MWIGATITTRPPSLTTTISPTGNHGTTTIKMVFVSIETGQRLTYEFDARETEIRQEPADECERLLAADLGAAFERDRTRRGRGTTSGPTEEHA